MYVHVCVCACVSVCVCHVYVCVSVHLTDILTFWQRSLSLYDTVGRGICIDCEWALMNTLNRARTCTLSALSWELNNKKERANEQRNKTSNKKLK